jgi:hypothetical protein
MSHESHHSNEMKNQAAGIGFHGPKIDGLRSSMRVDWLKGDTSWPALQAQGYAATIDLKLKTGTEVVRWAMLSAKQVTNLLANVDHPRFPWEVKGFHVFPLPTVDNSEPHEGAQ